MILVHYIILVRVEYILFLIFLSDVAYPFSSSFEERKCSPAEFQLKGMRSCHALLKCEDFDNVRIGKLLGYGAVKAVYHAKWNDYDVALCTLNDPRYELDFLSGIQNIKEFQQNPFTVQAVGFCVEEKMFLTEFHKNGNAANIAQILRSSLGTLDNVRVRMSLCYNYAQILSSLHHPVKDGIELTPRVICDSNDLHKLLSQLLLTDNMTLILNDMDALPKVCSDGIKCGHQEIKGTFVAPEQLWKFSENYDDDLMPGYDEKTDIWKAASVCEYFLDGVSEGEKVKTLLSPVHRRCRNVNPVNRPTANELLEYYATIMNAM